MTRVGKSTLHRLSWERCEIACAALVHACCSPTVHILLSWEQKLSWSVKWVFMMSLNVNPTFALLLDAITPCQEDEITNTGIKTNIFLALFCDLSKHHLSAVRIYQIWHSNQNKYKQGRSLWKIAILCFALWQLPLKRKRAYQRAFQPYKMGEKQCYRTLC